ncbi:MAG: hypothetical protein AAF125_05305 [Chloroflexota bacterium]
MSDYAPPPEDELDSRSRYRRNPSLISLPALLIGLIIGGGLGLYYTWNINPIVEVSTRPAQLATEPRGRYMAAVALSFSFDSDLTSTLNRLLTITDSGAPFEEMASTACEMVQRGHANSNTGFREIRSMVTLYQLQGQTGCADEVVLVGSAPTQEVVVVLPTPTEAPPATKTPTVAPTRFPTATVQVAVPTSVPVQGYVLINVATFCDTEISGVIEVYVQNFNGTGIPGEPVRVRWQDGEDIFYTGLKPERGAAYADFQMERDVAYNVDMPDRSDPSGRQLVATPCTTENGESAVTSYRVVFRPTG